ncbi:MAG TPA: O-antigen ligase family protein [Chitinophagaceae bacterium]|nr:O-antigen ligase family protein [Chitinophagaceae bacterium]
MKSHLTTILFLLYISFFSGLVFSFPAVSSISTGLLFIFGMIDNASRSQPLISTRAKNSFLLFCSLFYGLVLLGVLWSTDSIQAWSHVREKSGLLFIPLSLCCCDFIDAAERKKLMKAFSLLLAVASVYCFVISLSGFFRTGNAFFLFYHPLVAPLRQHAIHFSVYIFIAIVYAIENLRKSDPLFSRTTDIVLISFFSIFLFLLSSKLVIGFLLLYSVYSVVQLLRIPGKTRVMQLFFGTILLGSILLIVTKNPIGTRFRDMTKGSFEKIRQESFTPGDYFYPVQFRLLEWRFTAEILNENKAWLYGVSAGDAQTWLDKKYISKNMYIGEPERGDRGMLGYNTHNEFLEATLQFGIPGTVVMLLIVFSVARIIRRQKKRGLSFILLLLLAYLCTESLFETQYGLLLFTFFPLFMSLDKEK